MKRIIVCGNAKSTKKVIDALMEVGIIPLMIGTLEEEHTNNVSSYYDLSSYQSEYDIPVFRFKNINDESFVREVRTVKPDYIFIIGISQIVKEELLSIPNEFCVGAHPTNLPRFRGRAAFPWLILLSKKKSTMSLFKIDSGMDSGDIIFKKAFRINENDYVEDVANRADEVLFQLILKFAKRVVSKKRIIIKKQNDKKATFLLVRRPGDGRIDFGNDAKDILKLIRATSKPYPGAFGKYKGEKVVFWKAEHVRKTRYIGQLGQVALVEEDSMTIVCRNGLIKITDFEHNNNIEIKAGHKFN